MKKVILVLLALVIIFSNSVFANIEIGEMQLMTLEGTYEVSLTINDPDSVNQKLQQSYDIKDPLPSDIIQRDFKVDIKYIDGKYLLFDKGEELKNSGLSRDKQFFIFNFKYEVKDSSIDNILYNVEATLHFNEATQSFDIVEPKRLTLEIRTKMKKSDEIGYGSLGNGTFTMDKVGGKDKENSNEEKKPVLEQNIPRGITFVKGIVEVKRAGSDKWIRASRNMPLNPGDIVRTGKNSYADLGCSSSEFAVAAGSEIQLRPLSIITVPDKTLKVEKKSLVRVNIDDAIRNVYSLFGKEEFEVETPSTSTSIRGTDFLVDVDEEGNTTFLLNEGSILVKSKYDNSEIILSSGQKVIVPINKTLSNPQELSEKDKEAFTVSYEDDEEDATEDNQGNDKENANKDKKGGIGFFGKFLIAIILFVIVMNILKKGKKKKKMNT